MPRCQWVDENNPLYVAYHDKEWGVPVRDDGHLFEMLILEGAQAGLSWSTILNKREGYRKAYENFDIEKIAAYGGEDQQRLLSDPGIVRNRLKVAASIGNAQAYLALRDEGLSLSDFLWQFVDGRPIQNNWRDLSEVPASTKQSDAMSKALKKRGFRFVGSTICYAFMQGVGMVNDHTIDCPRHAECRALQESL